MSLTDVLVKKVVSPSLLHAEEHHITQAKSTGIKRFHYIQSHTAKSPKDLLTITQSKQCATR
jgi:hypothetical protein